MHYVYILSSKTVERLYIGCSSDLKTRIKRHNSGNVRSTKGYLPWILVYYEGYRAKSDTTKRERQLKQHAAKNDLKKQIKNSLKL